MDLPTVSDFYKGKSVLLTGATGFLGVVLLEELLRVCRGLKRIYIVLRPKKDVDPETRLKEMFERKIFCEMKQDQPELLKKVRVIAGYLGKPNLGISEEDIQTIVNEVSIVFHVAASTSFVQPLKSIFEKNFLSTHVLIEICRKMKKCDAFVFCSSAFANSNRVDIDLEEEVYRLPFPAQMFLNRLLKNASNDELMQLQAQCQPPWPNYYAFTKHLTENYLAENTSDLPVAIVRPSILSLTHEKPFPAYGLDTTGVSAMFVGIFKGVLKVIISDPESRLDTVPVDFAAHALIIAAERIHSGRWKMPLMVHCTSVHKPKNRDQTDMLLEVAKQQLVPLAFREPTNVKLIRNRILAKILTFYEHFVPAYGIDLMLRLSGKKPKVVSVYRYIDKAIDSLSYFGSRNFRFRTEKFQKLMRELNEEDKKVFVNPDAGEYNLKHVVENAPFYDWNIDKKTPIERKRAAKRNQLLTNLFQAIFLIMVGGLIFFLSWIVKKLLF